MRLAKGEATVNELVDLLPISQPAVSRHLKVLDAAGFIVRRVDGQRRPCRLAADSLGELDDYLGRLRDALETQYAGIDQLLQRMAEADTPSKPTPKKKPRRRS